MLPENRISVIDALRNTRKTRGMAEFGASSSAATAVAMTPADVTASTIRPEPVRDRHSYSQPAIRARNASIGGVPGSCTRPAVQASIALW